MDTHAAASAIVGRSVRSKAKKRPEPIHFVQFNDDNEDDDEDAKKVQFASVPSWDGAMRQSAHTTPSSGRHRSAPSSSSTPSSVRRGLRDLIMDFEKQPRTPSSRASPYRHDWKARRSPRMLAPKAAQASPGAWLATELDAVTLDTPVGGRGSRTMVSSNIPSDIPVGGRGSRTTLSSVLARLAAHKEFSFKYALTSNKCLRRTALAHSFAVGRRDQPHRLLEVHVVELSKMCPSCEQQRAYLRALQALSSVEHEHFTRIVDAMLERNVPSNVLEPGNAVFVVTERSHGTPSVKFFFK